MTKFSEKGSSARQREEATYMLFQDFLHERKVCICKIVHYTRIAIIGSCVVVLYMQIMMDFRLL